MKSRQVFKWYGGKGNAGIREWIIKNLPRTDFIHIYCEPFLGSGSIFLSQEPYKIEVLNDLDKEVVNFFLVCQNKVLFEDFYYRISFTPYAIEEFKRALNILKNSKIEDTPSIEHAWAFFVVQNQGISGQVYSSSSPGGWGRSFTSRANNASWWNVVIKRLESFSNRIKQAKILCMDALDCIRQYDSEHTLFYLDPPYVAETRGKSSTSIYTHETSFLLHERLVNTLLQLKGNCALSGYDNIIYKRLEENGWNKISRKTIVTPRRRGQKSVEKEECLWIKGYSRRKEKFLL